MIYVLYLQAVQLLYIFQLFPGNRSLDTAHALSLPLLFCICFAQLIRLFICLPNLAGNFLMLFRFLFFFSPPPLPFPFAAIACRILISLFAAQIFPLLFFPRFSFILLAASARMLLLMMMMMRRKRSRRRRSRGKRRTLPALLANFLMSRGCCCS